jgi:hypothetical protein
MNHDQNYKNLILDYPREAIAFFAASEAHAIDSGARIIPLREEQLKERLGERFRELDVPLLVEWSDGRRSALLSAPPCLPPRHGSTSTATTSSPGSLCRAWHIPQKKN